MEKDLLNKLYQECGLTKEDIFDSGQYKIITRSGIEKIQYANNIRVVYQPIHMAFDMVVIKAIGTKENRTIETFGEWNNTHAKKSKSGHIVPFYSVAMAEKRALSRCVLKLMNLYEHGVIGEDETIYTDPGDDPATDAQIRVIEGLLRSSTYPPEFVDQIERNMFEMTFNKARQLIEELSRNQMEAMDGHGYNQGDINRKLDRVMNDNRK